ncbi:MAG: MutS-related protein, partial [Bacteroidota bacterium]
TFLRTVGANLVLGMIGAPVCAEKQKFKTGDIFTSMNITDSLAKNESYFYAEIKRLKKLVDHAAHSEHLIVLLDEILTGTNTRDKEKASKAFLERLIQMRTTALIATHDLSLTDMENSHPQVIENKSFEVTLKNGEMSYDFILRNGIAHNMNALELLRQMKLI